ncbi:hypothetical protein FRC17_000061 [Serendipita sp. 399]|nr:hypothetical protein FRC17_000061 [Serendipita sp. 399]
MSRLTRSRSQSPSKARLKAENTEKSRLQQALSTLEMSDETTPSIMLNNIESLYMSHHRSQLMVLADHVVGRGRTIHVRRNIQELQKSNLPLSILKDVLSPTLLENRGLDEAGKRQKGKQRLNTLKEKTIQLENELIDLTDQLGSANLERECLRMENSQLRDLERAAELLSTKLERYQNSLGQSDIISKQNEAAQKSLALLTSTLDGSQEADDWSLEQDTAIGGLLDQTMDLLSTRAFDDPPLIARTTATGYKDTIMNLQSRLIRCNNQERSKADISQDFLLDDLPNGVSRDSIIELCTLKARRMLLSDIDAQEGKEEEHDTILAETKELFMRVEHQLQVTQTLMLETYNLINEIPKELHGELHPYIDGLKLALSTLDGAISTRKDDITAMVR